MRSIAAEFLDTNIIVYAFTMDPRAAPAQALLGGRLRHQHAGAQRIRQCGKAQARHDLAGGARRACRHPRPLPSHSTRGPRDPLRIAERYGYAMFDALMIAAALRAKCTVLYSEDMHDGMTIDRRLRIVDRSESRKPCLLHARPPHLEDSNSSK